MTPTDPQPTPEQMAKAHAYSGIAADINETFTLAEFLKAQEQSYLAGLTKGRELASAGVEEKMKIPDPEVFLVKDVNGQLVRAVRESLLTEKDKRIEELERKLNTESYVSDKRAQERDVAYAQLTTATQNLAKAEEKAKRWEGAAMEGGKDYAETIEQLCKEAGVENIQQIGPKLAKAEKDRERLREALNLIQKYTLAAVIWVERGQQNGLDATILDNIVRNALAALPAREAQQGNGGRDE